MTAQAQATPTPPARGTAPGSEQGRAARDRRTRTLLRQARQTTCAAQAARLREQAVLDN